MDSSYKFRNPKVFYHLEAIFEKLIYGVVRVDFEIHNKRITSITVYGKQRIKYKHPSIEGDNRENKEGNGEKTNNQA